MGKIKDQTQDFLVDLFDQFLDKRLDVVRKNDRITTGKVIGDMPDMMSRELYFEDIEFAHHPTESKASFELEAKTFIDYRYVKRNAKCEYQIEPSCNHLYVESIKGIFEQTYKGGIKVSCEIAVQGVLSKHEANKHRPGVLAVDNLRE